MSYILSALKKAEQERYSGHVPDLMTPQPSDDPPPRPESTGWKSYSWMAAIAGVVIVVIIAVQRLGDQPDNDTIAPLATLPVPPPPTLATAPTTGGVQPPAAEVAAPSSDIERGVGRRFPALEQRYETPRDSLAVREPAGAAANWGAFDEFNRVRDIDQLPQSELERLPPLKLTGHLYSLAHPTARKVILNGIALKEKQYLNGELMINEITPDGVILDFEGRLYRMGADHMFR